MKNTFYSAISQGNQSRMIDLSSSCHSMSDVITWSMAYNLWRFLKFIHKYELSLFCNFTLWLQIASWFPENVTSGTVSLSGKQMNKRLFVVILVKRFNFDRSETWLVECDRLRSCTVVWSTGTTASCVQWDDLMYQFMSASERRLSKFLVWMKRSATLHSRSGLLLYVHLFFLIHSSLSGSDRK